MAYALTHWLSGFLSSAARSASLPEPSDRKPMDIDVETLPDYRWRQLGFQQPKRRVE